MSFQYRGLKGEYEKHVVTEEEVNHRLKMLAQQNPRIIPVNDRASQNGDELVLDYAGFCDGVQFPGGTAEMQTLVLGSHTFIPGFEEQLIGYMPGDEVSVKVMFPSEYHAPDLAGKAAEFRCKIHQIREKTEYALDDVFAMEMGGVATFAEMKEQYAKAFQEYADNQSEMELQDNLLRAAAKTIEYMPTDAEIEAELDTHLETLKAQLAKRDLTLEAYCSFMNTDEATILEDLRADAMSMLKINAAMMEIARLEGLTAEQAEVDEMCRQICRANQLSAEEFAKLYDDAMAQMIKETVLGSKALELVRRHAVIEEVFA